MSVSVGKKKDFFHFLSCKVPKLQSFKMPKELNSFLLLLLKLPLALMLFIEIAIDIVIEIEIAIVKLCKFGTLII